MRLVSQRSSRRLALCLGVFCLCALTSAQTFVRVTDPANEAAADLGESNYNGAAWIDYDNDGDEDLFAAPSHLYRNDGNGAFSEVNAGLLHYNGLGSGCSWADYDNDGDLDLCNSGAPHSVVYRNDGDGVFTALDSGDINYTLDNRAWSCAWGDYDNDGNVDLILTHPAGFSGPPSLHNFVFHNDGPPDYGFTRITTGDILLDFAPFTVGGFADYDLDGDLDFFIGTGPVSSTGLDYLFHNDLIETGTATLTRITDGVIAQTVRDGQNINWIDYDNDGDLDCYITNYQGGVPQGRTNNLYRNDGEAGFTAITEGEIVTDRQVSLGNAWADFDNDGDLDCIVANEFGTNKYYRNNGDGTFTSANNAATISGGFRCPVAADYDDDGDLDLFISGVGTAQAFFRNDLNNGNGWIRVKCIGTASNRAAIGAVIRMKATIGGEPVWQLREVNTQNSFNGHSSLIAHFGLGDATLVDSIEIRWPSGLREYYTGAFVGQTMTLTEGIQSADGPAHPIPASFLISAFPNPFNSVLTLSVSGARDNLRLSLVDLLGREVDVIAAKAISNGRLHYTAPAALASGVYFLRAFDANQVQTLKIVLLK